MPTNVHPMHIPCQVKCAPRDVAVLAINVHNVHMDQKRHYLREWREYRGKTLEGVAAELEELASQPRFRTDKDIQNAGKTHPTLGRIENGKVKYSQPLLEMLAVIYDTDVGSLLTRDPNVDQGVWEAWRGVPEDQKGVVITMIKSLSKTGTNG